jgi:hypothetical protein
MLLETSNFPDYLEVLNSYQYGWRTVLLYRRVRGSFAVATWDERTGFVGDILACTGGIWHANCYFNAAVHRLSLLESAREAAAA